MFACLLCMFQCCFIFACKLLISYSYVFETEWIWVWSGERSRSHSRSSSREKGSSWHQYGWTAWLGVTSQTIIRYSTEMVSSWNASRTAIRLRSYSYIEWNVSYVNKMKHYYYHLKRNGIRKTLNLFISWGKVRTGLPANPTSQSIFVLFVSQGR